MSHSRFLLLTSLAVGVAAGCGDDTCGIGDAPADGLVASNADVALTFTSLTAGANNDCPVADAPAGVTSLTIMGSEENGTGIFTACVPRPDLLATSRTIGSSVTSEFSLVDFSATDANGCRYTLDRTLPPNGTAQGLNVCGNGLDKAGFILTLKGFVSLTRKCGTQASSSVTLALSARTAVLPQ